MTKREKTMLDILSTVDECVIQPFYNKENIIVSYFVMSGTPVRFESKPLQSASSGRLPHSEPEVAKEYKTDADKLLFLKQFGQYMNNDALRAYGRSHCLPCAELRYRYSETERRLLARLDAGDFDGPLDYYWESRYGSTFTYEIVNGIPIEYKQGKSTRFFDGKETETISKDAHIRRKYLTDDDKLEFLQRFGRDMADEEAFDYSWESWSKRYQK